MSLKDCIDKIGLNAADAKALKADIAKNMGEKDAVRQLLTKANEDIRSLADSIRQANGTIVRQKTAPNQSRDRDAFDMMDLLSEGLDKSNQSGREAFSGSDLAAIVGASTIGKRAGYSQKRLAGVMSEYGYASGHVKATVVNVNPQDFVNATTDDPSRIDDETFNLDLDRLRNESQTPFLIFKQGEIVGHEGRHRMQALARAGYDKVPVVMINADAEAGTRASGLAEGDVFKGQKIGEDTGLDISISNPVDISYDNTERLDTLYGEQGARVEALFQAAFHGTAHTFDRFSLDAIGTGEGAQAYGWGLYFASRRAIAEFYRDKLGGEGLFYDGLPITHKSIKPITYRALSAIESAWIDGQRVGKEVTPQQAKDAAMATRRKSQVRAEEDSLRLKLKTGHVEEWQEEIDALDAVDVSKIRFTNGNLMEVDIPDSDVLLDHDEQWHQQPRAVRKALDKLRPDVEAYVKAKYKIEHKQAGSSWESSGYVWTYREGKYNTESSKKAFRNREEAFQDAVDTELGIKTTGKFIYLKLAKRLGGLTKEGQKAASHRLNEIGIPGLRFLDAPSRQIEEEIGRTHNFVIWDESNIDVTQINDQLTQAKALQKLRADEAMGMADETAARKQRAEDLGFDTSRVWYHGTLISEDEGEDDGIRGFRPGPKGIFFTPAPGFTELFAPSDAFGSSVYPVYLNYGKMFDYKNMSLEEEASLAKMLRTALSESLDDPDVDRKVMRRIEEVKEGNWSVIESHAVQTWIKRNKYDSYKVVERGTGSEYIDNIAVFNPQRIRSVHAQFRDPQSRDILAQSDPDVVRDYIMKDWSDETGLDPDVITAYGILGREQRGEPEVKMMKAKEILSGGYLPTIIEHLGDLLNRLSPAHKFDWGYEESLGKIDKVLVAMDNLINFGGVFSESADIANRIKVPESVHFARSQKALEEWRAANEKLKTFSPVHQQIKWIINDVSAGSISDARNRLKDLRKKIETKEKYIKELRVYSGDVFKYVEHFLKPSINRAALAGFRVQENWFHSTWVKFDGFDETAADINRSGSSMPPLASFGFHFGTSEQAAVRASNTRPSDDSAPDDPIVHQVHLRYKSPLRLKENEGGLWGPNDVIRGIRKEIELYGEKFGLSQEDVNLIYTGDMAINGVTYNDITQKDGVRTASRNWDVNQLRDYVRGLLDRLGYDAIIYENRYESSGDSIIVWDPKNIRSVNAEFKDLESNNLLYQEDLTAEEVANAKEDRIWRNWKPKKTKAGKIIGAPEYIQALPAEEQDKAYNAMLRQLRLRIKEGTVERFWYEDSAEAMYNVLKNDLPKTEKFIQLVAIFSPQTGVGVNLQHAVKAMTHYELGKPADKLKVKTEPQNKKARDILYEGVGFKGRKTNSFYINHIQPLLKKIPGAFGQLRLEDEIIDMVHRPATIDMWMYRAFGYKKDAYGDDLGGGPYSFAENVTRKLTAEINSKLERGVERWDPHQVQAAIWTSMKVRYERQDVKDATNAESLKKGYQTQTPDGKYVRPADGKKYWAHNAVWRKHAMKMVTVAEATELARLEGANFGTYMTQMTHMVTHEAQPSKALNLEIFKASDKVIQMFTDEARALLYTEDGVDMLAHMLGVPLARVVPGFGSYDGNITPNSIAYLTPIKKNGEFQRDEVRAYAQALQYIFKQDAVPFYRVDPRAMSTKSNVNQQKYRIVHNKRIENKDGTITWKAQTVSKSITDRVARKVGEIFEGEAEGKKVETASEMLERLDKEWVKNPKNRQRETGEPPAYEIKGGKFSRGYSIRFDRPVTLEMMRKLIETAKRLQVPVDFTKVGPNEIHAINFRDDVSRVPFGQEVINEKGEKETRILDDVVWDDLMQGFLEEATNDALFGSKLQAGEIYVEGEYGEFLDWSDSDTGQSYVWKGGTEPPGLQAWVADRRAEFEQLIARYSGEALARREEEAAVAEKIRAEQRSLRDPASRLEQRGKQKPPRGSFEVTPEENIIRLFKTANLSTLMHESGHLFLQLELMGEMTPDRQKILDYLGAESADDVLVKAGETISPAKRAMHEKFARAFEAYLFEGKAPSIELRGVFRRFSAWLKEIYKSLNLFKSANDAEINDEIRGVFDRMLATDEQIELARSENHYDGQFFKNIKAAGMTAAEWDDYLERQLASKDRASETLTTKILKQLKRQATTEWNRESKAMASEIAEDLKKEPGYKFWDDFRGKGKPKISRESVIEEFGEVPDALKFVVKKGAEATIHDVAVASGYKNAGALLKDASSKTKVAEDSKQLAQEAMLKKHGDILNDGTLEREAQAAAHNEVQGKLILTELRALNRKVGNPVVNIQSLKDKAQELIDRTPLNELRPAQYRRQEVKAAMRAQKAIDENNDEEAALYKTQQAANFYIWKAADAAQRKRDSIQRRIAAVNRRKYTPKQMAPEYIRELRVYLAAYDFRKTSQDDEAQARDKLLRVARWIKQQQTETHEVQIYDPNLDAVLLEDDSGAAPLTEIQSYKTMTIKQLEAIDSMAKHMAYVGRKMADANKQAKLEEHKKIADSILEVFSDYKKAEKGTLKRKIFDAAKGYGSGILLHMDSVARYLDGWKDFGPVYRAVKSKIDRAVTEVLIPMQENAGADISEIYASHFERKDLRNMNKKQTVADKQMSRWEMISTALNWGNEGGRQAVLDSTVDDELVFPGGIDQVQEVLDALTANELGFVQDVIDYISTYKKALFALEKERHGVMPVEVEATPIVARNGTIRGGYFPLKYDSSDSFRVAEEEAQDLINSVSMGRFAKAQTKDGMLKERVGSGGRPVNLDMMVFHNHINEVIMMIALSKPVTEVQELINSGPFVKAMEKTGNKDMLEGMDVWIKDAAVGEQVGAEWQSRMLRHIRGGFSAATIGWNVGTILMQPLGLLQTMPVIGYGNTMAGLTSFVSHPNKTIQWVMERSAFMRERALTFNKDIHDTLKLMSGDPNNPGYIPDWMRNSYFAGIVYSQRAVDMATWLGAYKQAQEQFTDEADLIQFADRAVARSQSSGIWSDRTPIERGSISRTTRQSEYVRIWTALGSYFFAKGNVAFQLTSKTDFKRPTEALKWTVDMMVLFSLEAIIVAAFRGLGPDDDESTAYWFAKQTASNAMGAFPVIREVASAAGGFDGGGTLGAATGRIGKLLIQIEQGESDAALWKALNNVGGVFLKYPSGPMNRFIGAAIDDAEGKDVDPIDYLIWRKKD